VNKFNPSLMRGFRLSTWFVHELAARNARQSPDPISVRRPAVADYVRSARITNCVTIADKVAAEVERTLSAEAAHS